MEKLIISTFFLNILFFIFYEKISKFINIYDYPSKRKIHKTPTPIMGGIIIYSNIVYLFIFIVFLDNSFKSILLIENTKVLISFFITLSLIFILGLYDDKYDLSPNVRLFLLSVFIFNFLYFNNNLLITQLNFNFLNETLFLKKISFLFTFFCILVFVISMNMFDGTNLQSASFYFFLIIYFINNNLDFNLFLLFLIIPIIFFSIKNFQGKAFLGDGGTYLVSFIFSIVIINNHRWGGIESDEIVMLIIFPIVETVRLYFARLINNKNPFMPDKNHFHHIIRDKFNEKISLVVIIISYLIPITLFKILNNSLFAILLFLLIYFLTIYKVVRIKPVK